MCSPSSIRERAGGKRGDGEERDREKQRETQQRRRVRDTERETWRHRAREGGDVKEETQEKHVYISSDQEIGRASCRERV